MINKRYLVVASLFFAMAANSSAWAQQYARPVSTNTANGWTAVGAPTLHEAVDETTANGNTDYIDSGIGNLSTASLALSSVNDPGTYSNNHFLRAQCRSTNGGKADEFCAIALYDNGTSALIATLSVLVPRGSFGAVAELQITDASNITNYDDLRVDITATLNDGNKDTETVQVSWIELEVPAPANTAPSVTTSPATVISDSEATVGGNVSDDGNDPLLEVGVYYSQTPGFTPPTEFPPFLIASDPPTTIPLGNFAGNLTGLSPGTTYYYQAYARNSIGEEVDDLNEESFTTWDVPTLLATPTVTDIQLTSATLGGRVTDDGLTTVTECGVVWSDAPAPDLSDVNDFSATALSCDTGVDFTVAAGGLDTGTTYYFRSYAINAVGTAYSAQEGSFIPSGPPQLDATVDLETVTDTQALLGGNITDNGGSTITAVGIYWDTIGADPRNDGTHVPMTVAEPSFEQLVTGLTPGATIYFLAYATNSAGTTDSTIINFPTLAGAPTMDPTPTVANIVGDGADLGGTIISDGGGANLDCGVEWTTVSGEPYESSQSFEVPPDNGTCVEGAFAVTVSGLPSGLTYYFRAYASSDAGSDYSDEDSFVPQAAPIVVSAAEKSVTHNSAILGGDVTSDEGSPVTERGIYWDTNPINPDPESQVTKTKVPMGSGTETFEQTISLPSGQTIYFVAYATNSAGTSYSTPDRSFTTNTEPNIQASGLILTPFGKSIRATWTRGNGDGSLVAVWQDPDTIAAPVDLTDYIADPDYSAQPPPPETVGGSGNLVVYKGAHNSILVTGLDLSSTYHFAVYEYAGEGVDSDYIQTLPATDSATTTDTRVHNYDYRVNCEECHKHGTQRPRQDALETKCKTCHDAGGLASTKREFANHRLPERNPAIDYVDCGMCHELHKQSSYNTTKSISFIDATERVNKSFLRANVTKYVPNAAEPAVLHDDVPSGHIDQSKRVEGNPNNDPVQPADTPQRAVEGGDSTTARGYCQVCHTETAYHRNVAPGGSTEPAAHDKNGLMQCHDGSPENTACATDVNCGDCHEHNNNFTGVNNNLPCEDCHNAGQPPRPIITTQFDRLSKHIPGGSADAIQANCAVCHGNHNHDGFVYGLDADDLGTSWGTDAADTLGDGAGEVFEPHCLSCHGDSIAAGLPDDGNGDQTKTSPFTGSDLTTTNVKRIDSTSWTFSAHYRPSGTFPSSPVTCVGNGANGCHASGHGTQSNNLLASWDGISDPNAGDPAADTPVAPIDFCYNCHSADGPSVIDVETQFNTATNYQTEATSGNLVNQRHDITTADQTYSGGVVSCKDCHSVHVDSSATHGAPVVDPDTDTPLPPYSYTNSNYDSGGNFDPCNPNGLPPGTGCAEPDYIQFCLACHDGPGNEPPGVTMPGNMTNIAARYAVGVNQHGAGDGGGTAKGYLKYPWNAQGATTHPGAYAALNCTTCHGAHGSGNIFNLRESITVAGVQMRVGGWTGDGVGDPRAPYNCTTPGDPATCSTVYKLPPMDGRNINDATGVQENRVWGAWCSFCHQMEAHGQSEDATCNQGHLHGGGNF